MNITRNSKVGKWRGTKELGLWKAKANEKTQWLC